MKYVKLAGLAALMSTLLAGCVVEPDCVLFGGCHGHHDNGRHMGERKHHGHDD